jgi:hypothetical protein
MKMAIISPKVQFALTIFGTAACVAIMSPLLPEGFCLFAWGVAAGLLSMLALVVVRWLLRGTDPLEPVDARQIAEARSRRMKIATAMIFPMGCGLGLVWQFGLPSDMQAVVGGVVVGILLMAAILIAPAFWAPSKPNPLLRKRTAPLEDTSSHTMVVPPPNAP